jgi:hypothetical protein
MYAVWIQEASSIVEPKLAPISARELATIWVSSTAMKVPPAMEKKPIHVPREMASGEVAPRVIAL